VLHAFTDAEHCFPTQNAVISSHWCTQLQQGKCWKAPIVEIVGELSSGRVNGSIAVRPGGLDNYPGLHSLNFDASKPNR
jgi:hypothetical protein